MNDKDVKNIDVWLASLSKESIVKILTIVNILQSMSELTESTFFTVPYEAFHKAGLDDTSMETILTKLWRKGIINLMDCDDEHHSASDWNKEFDLDNSFNDETGIKLNPAVFEYLHQALINNKKRIIIIPEGRDFTYENGELHIQLQDKSICTLDLSKATKLRPVFESFFYLFKNGSNKLFEQTELLDKHEDITGKRIVWRLFMNRKSSIQGKMINSKPCLKNRIIWQHDKETDKYKFDILPLSDK